MSDAPHRLAPRAPAGAVRHAAPVERNTAYPDTRHGLAGHTGRLLNVAGLLFLVGLWLVVAPYVLGFDAVRPVAYDDMGIGAALAALGLLRLTVPLARAAEWWVVSALGAWTVAAPLALHHVPAGARGTTEIVNGMACGVVAIGLAAYGIALSRHELRRG